MVKEARYLVSNGEEEPHILIINYYHNRYRLMDKNRKISEKFRIKIGKIATLLLKRKHRINYAYKFRDL